MKVETIPTDDPYAIVNALCPKVDGELEGTASRKELDKLYHVVQLQALRIDELENRLKEVESTIK